MTLTAQPTTYIQPDGTLATACCGPAVPLGTKFRWPSGEATEGLCCHYGALRDHEVALLHRNEVEWDAVRAHLNPANRRTS